MRKLCLLSLFIFLTVEIVFPRVSFSQSNNIKGSGGVSVSATVGSLTLSVAGFISPSSSVVMTSDNNFLTSSVATPGGNFTMPVIPIKRGFSHFCLDAIDFHRLGESTSCITFAPATNNIVLKDLFLPPTIGLEHTVIAAGAKNRAFGYTMPNAQVTLHLNGKLLTTTADTTGYYQFILQNLPAGDYSTFATATFNKKDSLAPSRVLKFKSLSLWDQFLAWLRDLFNQLWHLLTSISLGPLWLAIPIIILIIILILKLRSRKKKEVNHDTWMTT